MSDSTDQSIVESVQSRVDGAGSSLPPKLEGVSEDVSHSLDEAVGVIDERTSTAGEYVNSVRQDPRGTLQTVLDVLEEYIRNNELDITISGHEIQVQGDDDGLRKIDAELERALNGKDVRLEYDRDAGIDVEYGQKAQ